MENSSLDSAGAAYAQGRARECVLISADVAVPAKAEFVYSIVADWTNFSRVLELISPHPIKPDVII